MKAAIGEVLTGPAGSATEVLLTLERFDKPDLAGTVAMWFLVCPGQSIAWDRYALSVIHLRDIEGARPADIAVPGATHELILHALDPARRPEPRKPRSWVPLSPFNAVEQIELPHDAAARELARLAAKSVVAGFLPAEPMLSGAREPWHSTMIDTAAHLRGEHG